MQTQTSTTIRAIIPPFDKLRDPESVPEAPASESTAPLPADDPTSPADGPVLNKRLLCCFYRDLNSPLPGCWGDAVASAEKKEETELADISGVSDTEVVVAAEGGADRESCAVEI
jgi:hypothetical protein